MTLNDRIYCKMFCLVDYDDIKKQYSIDQVPTENAL